MMNGEEVRNMSDEELGLELEAFRRKLFDLRTQTVTEKLEDTTLLKKTRRDIARMMTEQRARELANKA